MTIRKKTLLAFGAILLVGVAALVVGAKFLVFAAFSRLETNRAQRSLSRVSREFEDTLSTLAATAGDWAHWDDAYDFALHGSGSFAEDNLTVSTLRNLRLNMMAVLDSRGEVLAGCRVEPGQRGRLPLGPRLARAIREAPTLWLPGAPRRGRAGPVVVGERVMLVAAEQILRTDLTGPPRGALVVGRLLGPAELARVGSKLSTRISVVSLRDAPLAEEYRAPLAELLAGANWVAGRLAGDRMAGYGLLRSVAGEPAALLKVDFETAVQKIGRQTVRLAGLWLVGLAVAFGATVALCLDRLVLGRLARLTETVERLRPEDSGVPGDLACRSDELGRLAGAIGQLVARERERSRQLQASEERCRGLLAACPDPVIAYDPDGSVRYVNDAFVDIYGWTLDEVAGRRLDFFVPPEEVARSVEVWRKTLLGEKVFFETVRLNKQGRPLRVQITSAIQRDAAGTHVASLVIHRDVTEQRRAEEEQRRLELRAVRSQRLESLGVLAGGIAHDFNNILTPIIGFTEQAIDDLEEGSRTRGNLEIVLEASERARDLVKQILAFSRGAEERAHPVSATEALRETVQLLRASLPADVEIATSFRAERDAVLASPAQLHQIFMNLGTNAGQALAAEGGRIEIGLEEVSILPGAEGAGQDPALAPLEPGDYLRVTFSDTGCGMPPEIVERIFDPFFTTKQVGRGTGMGLAVVHGIVAKMGGTVTVQSEPGKGSRFSILLPRIDDGDAGDERAEGTSPGGSGERVLLVDDEPAVLRALSVTLGRLGYDVVAEGSSTGALSRLQAAAHSFDLVITDQTMPKLSGTALAREARRLRDDLPVLLYTGFSDALHPEALADSGVREVLPKPATLHELAAAVRRSLEKGGRAPGAWA